jgi:hypothetical protein
MTQTPQHPGRIVYLDGNTGDVVSEEPADQVPDEFRFAPDEDGALIPILKVVATVSADGRTREIFEFGPDDALLRTTLQRREE